MYEMFIFALGLPDEEKMVGENFPTWGPLEGLPPTYLPPDECHPIRDQFLKVVGVKTRTDYYRGLPNMFVQFPELGSTIVAGTLIAAVVTWVIDTGRGRSAGE